MSRRDQEKLYAAITGIREALIEQAQSTPLREEKRRRAWRRPAAAAACLCLLAGAGAWGLTHVRMGSAGGGNGGHGEGTAFLSYAGPVFPLALAETAEHVDAARTVTLDFSAFCQVPETVHSRGWDTTVAVTDETVLTNHGQEDAAVTAVYPFPASLRQLDAGSLPAVTVDGLPAETRLLAGTEMGYTGSWEDYRDGLTENTLSAALSETPEAELLSRPVTVYALDNARVTAGEGSNPCLTVETTVDPTRTSLFTWGFHIGGQDLVDQHTSRLSEGYSIPKPGEKDWGTRYIIVMGQDLTDYTVQGYQNGSLKPGEDLEAAVDITRTETTFGEILRQVAELWYQDREGQDDTVSFDLWFTLFCRDFAARLPEPGAAMDLNGWPGDWLEEAFSWCDTADRVFYLAFDLVIPAGGSAVVTAELTKEASFDYHCAGTENQGVYGYDLMTRHPGGNLTFTAQTVRLTHTDRVEILRQNLGFDLEAGITAVPLDPGQEHYYLEVRRTEEP